MVVVMVVVLLLAVGQGICSFAPYGYQVKGVVVVAVVGCEMAGVVAAERMAWTCVGLHRQGHGSTLDVVVSRLGLRGASLACCLSPRRGRGGEKKEVVRGPLGSTRQRGVRSLLLRGQFFFLVPAWPRIT